MPSSKNRRRSRPNRRYTPEASTGTVSRASRRWFYVGVSTAVGFIIILGLLVTGLPGVDLAGLLGAGNRGQYVAGVGQQTEVAGDRSHFSRGTPIEEVVEGGYTTDPPTSGRHWGHWSDCGFFRGPPSGEPVVENEVIVHNMEHGNIVLSYHIADPDLVNELEDLWNSIPDSANWGVARWYDGIAENQIALTTWGVIDTWNIDDNPAGLDPDRIERFFEAYRGTMGPEFPNGSPCRGLGLMSPDAN